MNKAIINLACTGMIPTKEMSSFVPLKVNEIIEDVKECINYGVSMIHLHARDKEGNPTWEKEIYQEIVDGIREFDKDVVICVSTSGRVFNDFEKRSSCLEVKGIDMASLTLSSLNFNQQASVNSPDMIQDLATKMREIGIKPELEAFDIGMINYAKYLKKKGLIEDPLYINLILGNIACSQANLLNLGVMLNEMSDIGKHYFSVAGVGDSQLWCNLHGMLNGGGVRTGLEDNIYMTSDRKKLATNLGLVKRIFYIAECLEIELANSCDVRNFLELERRSS